MKLALVRYKYNPYGGAERIIERLGRELIKAGTFSNISILSRDWRPPSGSHSDSLDSPSMEYHPIRSSGWTRYGRHKSFLHAATRALGDMQGNHITQTHERLPGCDIYRAGDGVHKAWLHRLGKQRSWLGRQFLELDPYHQLTCQNELLIANNP